MVCQLRHLRAQLDAAKALDELRQRQEDNKLKNSEIATAIELGDTVVKWLEDLKAKALEMCLDGQDVPGLKAVEGRSLRAWSNQADAFAAAVKAGVPDEMLYERKPVTLTQLESLMGKKNFKDTLGEYVVKPAGKPTLVKDSDKRNAITRTASVEDDFGN